MVSAILRDESLSLPEDTLFAQAAGFNPAELLTYGNERQDRPDPEHRAQKWSI